MTILDFLVRRYRFMDEAGWEAALKRQGVMFNRGVACRGDVLHAGDEVLYRAPESPEPEVDRDITVIFEDAFLIAVNKTGNLPCHPGGCYQKNTLLDLLREECGLEHLHLINRLDRETSGLVVFAKDSLSAKKLSGQFLARRVGKFYSVLVEGDFPERLRACGWMTDDENSAVRKKRRFLAGGSDSSPGRGAEWAETHFERVRRCGELSLLDVSLMTGRQHQIRATLCSQGYPVVGDKIYGVDETLFIRFINGGLTPQDHLRLRMGRQALHARELHLQHPHTGDSLVLAAPLPRDMEAMLEEG